MKRAVLLTSLLLAGCNSTEPLRNDAAGGSEQAAHLPPDYRQIIAQEIKTSSEYQSVGVKDAQISNPKVVYGAAILQGGVVASVCIRYKIVSFWSSDGLPATNQFMFVKRTLIHSGLRISSNTALIGCGADRTYAPFPEVNHDYRP
jgi:hypothetical protein